MTRNGSPAPTQVFRLDNGLTVLIHENHDVEVATADVWVGTGSAGETPEVSGISHFLEHMMFKGTKKYGLGQIEREIENVGGVCNAGTSYDFTHYYVTLPSENIGRGIEMLGEMMYASTLDAAELEKERLVILEEYRRKQDDPDALLFDDVYEQVYVAGPYHRSVIGTEKTIRSITHDQMFDYYGRHYAPSNMTLVVAGDVDPEATLVLARDNFGTVERPLNALLAEPEPVKTARSKRHHRKKTTGGEVYFSLAWGASGTDAPETIVPLDVAQYILGQGRASILYQEVKERQRLASTIAFYYSTHRHSSLCMVDATCEPEKQKELRAAIDEILDRFVNEPIPEDQFNRAKRLLTSGHLFSFETTGAVTGQIGYYYTLTGGTEFLDHYLDRLDEVRIEDVQSAFAESLEQYDRIEVSVGPEANGAD